MFCGHRAMLLACVHVGFNNLFEPERYLMGTRSHKEQPLNYTFLMCYCNINYTHLNKDTNCVFLTIISHNHSNNEKNPRWGLIKMHLHCEKSCFVLGFQQQTFPTFSMNIFHLLYFLGVCKNTVPASQAMALPQCVEDQRRTNHQFYEHKPKLLICMIDGSIFKL